MPVPFTIIIPTLNAASYLGTALAALIEAGPALRIIIVDGGSQDDTLHIAQTACRLAANVQFINAPRGRGSQLAAGIAAASTPWLLLLHADTMLSPGWFAACQRHMAQTPDHDRAYYGRFALASPDARARRIEAIVAWRCWRFALPYGDQGLLISASQLHSAGGMNELPLMEDVTLIRRIGRAGLAPADFTATSAAARYERDGWWARPARNLLCLALWRMGVPPRLILKLYK
ncbi:MAG: hypothetical protein B7Z78_07245 [Rhodospirillales bacterium 20-60-12]|nr:MAG: hypothetical protein B7Z78_07245 [Rhodospirillales bacterium 20-60-12]HQT68627.1 glycosyltransferase [Acetobacteraceae bacterium]HQU02094.1 glycosyltransferase [Acetobacteraceae bacterium]